MEEEINFSKIEKKWQKKWEKGKIFEVSEKSKKPKFYVLEMFPYPSADGLHMGHALNFTIGDVYARFKRMRGFNVLYPMGYDALGLPAENAAIKAGKHPQDYTNNSIKNFIRQQKSIGLSYDWTRVVNTASPDYYRWDQWIFLKMFEKGLAYQKEAAVNFCSKCDSVLANEQVVNGKCWRHEDNDVEIKHLKQWFFKITDYADELYEDIDGLDWPERTKAMQRNWIGKSHGVEIDFEISKFGDISNKEFVFLHAYGDSIEDAFWVWLKEEIELRGGKVVFNKTLPDTQNPKSEKQAEFVLKNYKFNENTIVVAHSLGNILIMKILEKVNSKISGILMVAPPFPERKEEIINGKAFKDLKPRPDLAKYCDWKFDFNKIKEKTDKIIILEDKKDHIVPFGHPKKLAEILGAEYILSTGNRTHFNNEKEEAVLNALFDKWPIFTTRPDTIFGVTFMVVSAQHSRLMELVTEKQKKEVEKFLKKIKTVSQKSMKDVDELNKEGVFTGSYAINPATDEKVPIYAGNFVVADYGSGMVMAVPSHDQRDFEFAKKYGIEIRQVIAPFYKTTSGKDAIRPDKKTVTRDAIFAVVKHWKEDKYICLDWKGFEWKSFLMGGIESGESAEDAVRREVREETGYYDIKSVKRIGPEVHSEFFAEHKDINRYGRYKMFLVELKSDKHEQPDEKETINHNAIWLEKDKISGFLNLDNHKFAWQCLQDGERAYTNSGILINSQKFDGIESEKAKDEITEWLNKQGKARKVVNFKLRDWLVSRQRYWGTPIPVVYCEKCGVVPVPEKELPVELPKEVKFGKGNPLLTNEKWISVKCPKCSGKARRETDTMDTFVNSSWYFLRYCDSKNDKKIFDKDKVDYWCPIDQYIGGAEHATMHLIYFRFYTKFLADLGLIKFREPAKKLFHQGMLLGEGGIKMSKSKGNVVNPDAVSEKYGIDTARYFLLSLASPDKPRDWSEKGIQGSLRFVKRIFSIFENIKIGKDSEEVKRMINRAIKDIGSEYENFDYRTATIKLKELFESFSDEKEISRETLEKSLILLSPICPHVSEELWEKIGKKTFVSLEKWPEYSEIKEKKQKGDLNQEVSNYVLGVVKKVEEKQKVSKVFVYVMPFEIKQVDGAKISKKIGKEVEIFAVNDSKKYDPENKAKKAIPGKPGVYVE